MMRREQYVSLLHAVGHTGRRSIFLGREVEIFRPVIAVSGANI